MTRQVPTEPPKRRAEAEFEGWPELVPLDEYHALPSFPTKELPIWLRDYVAAVATAFQVPSDLPGSLALAAIASVAAKRIEIEAREDWLEPANLYMVVALDPGNRKTGAAREVFGPLVAIEEELQDEWGRRVQGRAAERRVLIDRQNQAERQAAKEKSPTDRGERLDEVKRLAEELEAKPELHLPRLLTDDTTPEACSQLIAVQGGRIAVLTAETDLFEVLGGRYNGGTPTVGVFLAGHAGDPLRVDRVGRDPIVVKSPAITLGIATQPHVLERISATHAFRERGLTQRILYSLPASPLGTRNVSPPPIPTELRATYRDGLARLVRELGLPIDGDAPRRLRLEAAARDRLTAYRAALEPRLGPNGDLSHIAGWASKLPGACVRIAALIHLAEGIVHSGHYLQEVSAASMESALRLGDYYLAHAIAALDVAGADPALADARAVWAWIRRRRLEEVNEREVLRNAPIGRSADRRDAAIGELADRGYLLELPRPTGPGRKARRYAVRRLDTGRNGQNPEADRGFVHSVHYVRGDEREKETTAAEASPGSAYWAGVEGEEGELI